MLVLQVLAIVSDTYYWGYGNPLELPHKIFAMSFTIIFNHIPLLMNSVLRKTVNAAMQNIVIY
jgi:hypothetical protein